jgi:hypothetical protein
MHALDQAWLTIKREFDEASERVARTAARDITAQLNRVFRRLSAYQTEDEWIAIVSEGARRFASDVIVLEVQGTNVKMRAGQGADLQTGLFAAAPALANAIDSKDPVVALRTAQEVGTELAGSGGRVRIVPITNGERVAALLMTAETDETNAEGLELLAGLAAAVLNRRKNQDLLPQITPQVPQTAVPAAVNSKAGTEKRLPDWADLSEAEQTLHLRAQRMARVAVAEMQLARPDACAGARQGGDVYLFLKPEIDRARDSFRKQFMTMPSMVDYLHLELLRVLADDDATKLGVDYPGPMV